MDARFMVSLIVMLALRPTGSVLQARFGFCVDYRLENHQKASSIVVGVVVLSAITEPLSVWCPTLLILQEKSDARNPPCKQGGFRPSDLLL
jgi:hypothetical protein